MEKIKVKTIGGIDIIFEPLDEHISPHDAFEPDEAKKRITTNY